MKTFTTVDLNRHLVHATSAVQNESVFITHHQKLRVVLMVIEDYDRQRGADDQRRTFSFDTVPFELEDWLLALADRFDPGGVSDD